MASRVNKLQKPLFVIQEPVKAKAYSSTFTPFESLKFIDTKKLKKVREQWLELGTVEALGRSSTLVAKFENGEITGAKLHGCAGCEGKAKKTKINRKLTLALRDKLQAIKDGTLKVPLPSSPPAVAEDIRIPIWPWPPIVIIVEGGTDGFCIAIMIGSGKVGSHTVFCFICFGSEVMGDCL